MMVSARFLVVRVAIAGVAVAIRSSFGAYEPGAVAVRACVFNPVVPFITGRTAADAFTAVPNVAFAAYFAAERAAAAVPVMLMRLYFAAAAAVQPFVPVVTFCSALAAYVRAPEEFFGEVEGTPQEANEKVTDEQSAKPQHDPPKEMVGIWLFESAQDSPGDAVDKPSNKERKRDTKDTED